MYRKTNNKENKDNKRNNDNDRINYETAKQ